MSDEEWTASLRMPEREAELLRMAAQVRGMPINTMVREAVLLRIEQLRHDDEFQARLRESIERNQELLDRLADNDGASE